MVDTVSSRRRSEIMARVRARDTGPELVVRRLVYSMGYRYRLHDRSLPGTPDLVFRRMHKLIFVHGCFWHRHTGCALARWPKSHTSFWRKKLLANKERDRLNLRRLRRDGWSVLVVWECQLEKPLPLRKRLGGFLHA